jgi:Mn2+/Fe2+ NRAMP family transporter
MNDQVLKQARELEDAEAKGFGSAVKVYAKYSGPGWVQSAITLGGGSLSGALFLGILGGTSLLWLQLVAIIMGVIMLSAISYITLSTGKKPFQAISDHINPALAWGWISATIMANMLWCMPQFSLCFAALQKNLVGGDVIKDTQGTKIAVSLAILAVAFFFLKMNESGSKAGKFFDLFLKLLVGAIVLSFFAVVVSLTGKGQVDWGLILRGFIPNPGHWNEPGGEIPALLANLSEDAQEYWSAIVVEQQRSIMIGAAATAVGINMTFLLPYNLLSKGWNKSFRGISRFDLCTAMALPYILATTCVVIASASMFHGRVDQKLVSSDPAIMQTSANYSAVRDMILIKEGKDPSAIPAEEAVALVSTTSVEERKIASSLIKRNAFQLSAALSPVLGEQKANLVFGFGIFGMGFSTIIILMLINGYAFSELFNKPQGGSTHLIGCLVAGVCGAIWPLVWDGPAKLWLAILVSAFGMMLLPIAYSTFFLMMNSDKIMGDEKPKGDKLLFWNILMGISVIGAFIAAISAVITKASDPKAGFVVTIAGAVFALGLAAYASAPKIRDMEQRIKELENK